MPEENNNLIVGASGEVITAASVNKLAQLVQAMKAVPQVECPVTHSFTPGLYVRELFIPKGSAVVSKIHKTTHPFVVTQGELLVWSPQTGVQRIRAPYRGVTTPGVFRLAVVLEDTVWVTFHATDKTEVSDIEAEVVLDPLKFLEEQKCHTLE